MATYKTKLLCDGSDGVYEDCDSGKKTYYTAARFTVLVEVNCAPEDEVLTFPSHDDGKPITHIGYSQLYAPSREEWHDWHHCRGGVRYPAVYMLSDASLGIPANIKKIIIPETVQKISPRAFAGADSAVLEVHPDNPYLTVEDNKIVKKAQPTL